MGVKPLLTASALAMGLGGLWGTAALAGETGGSTSATTQAGPGKKDPSKRVCKSVIPTGTRLSARECRTQAEWDEHARQTRDELDRQKLENSSREDPRVGGN